MPEIPQDRPFELPDFSDASVSEDYADGVEAAANPDDDADFLNSDSTSADDPAETGDDSLEIEDARGELVGPEPIAEVQAHRPRALAFHEIHFIGSSTLHDTPHPDERLQEQIAIRCKRELADRARLADYLDRIPNSNGQYEAQIAAATDWSAREYGVNPPVTVLPMRQFNQAHRLVDARASIGTLGAVLLGQVLLLEQPHAREAFGPDYMGGLIVHELGHYSADDGLAIVTREMDVAPPLYHHPHIYTGDGGRQYDLQTLPESGFVRVPPDFGVNSVAAPVGSFWEEGFVDSGRVRFMQEQGIAWPVEAGHEWQNFIADHSMRLDLADPTPKKGLVRTDGARSTVRLPWRYTNGVNLTGAEPQTLMSTPALAAYAVDLLDQRLPGLYETMRQSRRQPALQQEVRDRINSLAPDLYETLELHSYDPADFNNGLRSVITVLAQERGVRKR